jgi:uncharacterized protein (TIGR00106 family)
MNAIAEFTIIPIGVGVSLSKYVAICEQVLLASGLSYELHANGTNIEGEWDEVMQGHQDLPRKTARDGCAAYR